jgi:hypothetical protein
MLILLQPCIQFSFQVLHAQGFDTMREDLREALEGFDMEDDNEIEFTSFLAATMDVNTGMLFQFMLFSFIFLRYS